MCMSFNMKVNCQSWCYFKKRLKVDAVGIARNYKIYFQFWTKIFVSCTLSDSKIYLFLIWSESRLEIYPDLSLSTRLAKDDYSVRLTRFFILFFDTHFKNFINLIYKRKLKIRFRTMLPSTSCLLEWTEGVYYCSCSVKYLNVKTKMITYVRSATRQRHSRVKRNIKTWGFEKVDLGSGLRQWVSHLSAEAPALKFLSCHVFLPLFHGPV